MDGIRYQITHLLKFLFFSLSRSLTDWQTILPMGGRRVRDACHVVRIKSV